MDWLATSFYWYIWLFLLGIVFLPLTRRFFHSFPDQGYAFSKTIGLLILSYLVFLFGTFKILIFSQATLFFLLIGLALILGYKGRKIRDENKLNLKIIILEEVIFLLAFLSLTYIRGQEPSIRSLEKFMDFGFINSILNSRYFPPLDMWYAKEPINYYYFGHLTGAVLIKLTGIQASAGYNLILSTIFAQSMTSCFSLITSMIYWTSKKIKTSMAFGFLGSLVLNLAGNLHTVYLFTSGYPNEKPVPFWKILSGFTPEKYWYPNATRFVPFTIHEFPSYSYVVADLHGHVFDIPFVILTLALLFTFFTVNPKSEARSTKQYQKSNLLNFRNFSLFRISDFGFGASIVLGFMTAVHYMTNAFDGPIYILLSIAFIFLALGINLDSLKRFSLLVVSFIAFSLPFSLNFSPFISGVGLNCSPDFLVKMKKFGPFIFEKGNCQVSALWMLFILWGFFLINFITFLLLKRKSLDKLSSVDKFVFLLFIFGFFMIIIPEFFYIKDIYPAHFRANTMFKLGYQAFMMMSIAASYVLYQVKSLKLKIHLPVKLLHIVILFLVLSYPFFAFPSYYGKLRNKPEVDGAKWLLSEYVEDYEIIEFLKKQGGQPVILEAQGDSYTDFNKISAYTGFPTVAGWWVHEWLWRGSSDAVGSRIPEVELIYQSNDLKKTRDLIQKYGIKFIVVSNSERSKYKNLKEDKFSQIGKKVFESTNKIGALYQVE